MARTHNPFWTGWDGTQGAIGKKIVFKRIGKKTFVSKYPNMTKIKPSAPQISRRSKFADAVVFAKKIVSDPVKKAAYKVAPGKSVYHTALKDYLETH
jgi:hypothetical protein